MSGGDLSIRGWTAGSIGVVELDGPLFLPDVSRVLAAITSALQSSPHDVVVVDVSQFAVPVSSTMLTVFPAALRRNGGWPHVSLHLAGGRPALRRELHSARMQRYLPVHGTLEEALTSSATDVVTGRRDLAMVPEPVCLSHARTAVRDLWSAASASRRDEAVLVVNELATNAMRHVAQPFTVSLAASRTRMLVAVTDPGRQEPILRPLRSTTTAGRGMQLVDRLSDAWGVRLVHPHGKTVWAAMGLTPSPHRFPRSRSSRVG